MSFELVAMTSLDAGRPIRVANHPARTSPKLPGFTVSCWTRCWSHRVIGDLPVGTTNLSLEPSANPGELTKEKYAWKK